MVGQSDYADFLDMPQAPTEELSQPVKPKLAPATPVQVGKQKPFVLFYRQRAGSHVLLSLLNAHPHIQADILEPFRKKSLTP